MSGPRISLPARGPRALEIARLAAILLLFLAAPTVGDIGSCGESPADLDAVKFFCAKENIDCGKCVECGMATAACERACGKPACDAKNASQTVFPLGCYPLIHDGEVCLNALEASGCDEYRGFMADEASTIPTECNFCPSKPAPIATDAGADGATGEAPEGE
jgi:hypothetical protein